MPCCQSIMIILALGLLWSSITLTNITVAVLPGETGNYDLYGSILDTGRSFRQASSDGVIVLDWPESFGFAKVNNPPNVPNSSSKTSLGMPKLVYNFSAYAIDPDGDKINYSFDWGDETASVTGLFESGMAAKVGHTWNKSGTYQVRVSATDCKGASSALSLPLTITIDTKPNNPSKPLGPSSAKPNMSCSYSISSIDPDGDKVKYIIDWGDEATSTTGFMDSDIVAEASHIWNRTGTYLVKAIATDHYGVSSEWSLPLAVKINSPPNKPSKPSGSDSIYAWSEYICSSSVVDPDGDSVKLTFDWGDGNTTAINFVESGKNVSASHRWGDEGVYRIRVIAIDEFEDPSDWSENLTILVNANDRPDVPANLYGPNSGYTRLSNNYFTMAKDFDNDLVTYSFDWGDGTTSTTKAIKSGSLESASHNWSKPGTYHIKASAIDSKGASSEWSNDIDVIVADNDPPDMPIVPSGPTVGRSKSSYKYATSAEDPDGDSVKYVFDWGDDTTSWTGLSFINSGKNESVSHKWGRSGTYQVKAMALDDKGASSGWSNSLIVNIS